MKIRVYNKLKGYWIKYLMIDAVIEIGLVAPYNKSFATLLEFCNIWQCKIRGGGTMRHRAIIRMPAAQFKQIFGANPIEREYKVPSGTDHFIEQVKVKKVITDDKD